MKISVIGLGYIGLPTAAILASKGLRVKGIDINLKIVEKINKGEIHIVEPGLNDLVANMVNNGNLSAHQNVEESDVFIISVPTPFKNDHEPDITYVEKAIESIGPNLKKGDLVVLESTCPVGTTEKMNEILKEMRPDLIFPSLGKDKKTDVSIVYCPERVLPGDILKELVHNNRIIGGVSNLCSEKALSLYEKFVEAECLFSDCRTAELCKLTENSFRDLNIAFANELSLICDQLGVNVRNLIKVANKHPRVNILSPGAGVGGHCIAVDPWFIVHSAPNESKLIRLAREVNDYKPKYLIEEIKKKISRHKQKISDLTIATFGISFKPNIDDLRESPALEIAKALNCLNTKKHFIVEPNIKRLPEELINKRTELCKIESAISEGDILVFLVNHTDFERIKEEEIKNKLILDIAGIFDK